MEKFDHKKFVIAKKKKVCTCYIIQSISPFGIKSRKAFHSPRELCFNYFSFSDY